MIDDPVTEMRNFLTSLRDCGGLETLCLAGVERSGQILVGGTLGMFPGLVVLVESQTEPRYEHSWLPGGRLLPGIQVRLPQTNGGNIPVKYDISVQFNEADIVVLRVFSCQTPRRDDELLPHVAHLRQDLALKLPATIGRFEFSIKSSPGSLSRQPRQYRH